METQITLSIITMISAPVGTALTALLLRRKYRVEIDGMKADVAKKSTDTQGAELDNVRKGNEILMQQIVEPLKAEIKTLREDVQDFRKAIEQIPACPHATNCPVSIQLCASKKGNGDKAPPTK